MEQPFKPEGELVKDHGKVFLTDFENFDDYDAVVKALNTEYLDGIGNYDICNVEAGEESETHKEIFFKMVHCKVGSSASVGYRRMLFVIAGTEAVNLPNGMQSAEPEKAPRLTRIEEFKNLPLKARLTRIADGENRGYFFAGINPLVDQMIIVISTSSYADVRMFRIDSEPRDAREGDVWLQGYDSVKVGEIRIMQMQRKIDSTREIYIEGKYK